jgi:hypothetical protein
MLKSTPGIAGLRRAVIGLSWNRVLDRQMTNGIHPKTITVQF